jgi:hypothetical protein
MQKRFALALLAAFPLAVHAQTPPPAAPPPEAAPAAAAPAPAAPAAPAAAPAAPSAFAVPGPGGSTIDFGGWLVLNGYYDVGGLNAADLARFAIPAPADERALTAGVRQSRLRMNFAGPADGLFGGAKLKGLVEVDFMAGYSGSDPSMPIIRLRHAWLAATWKDLGNLTFTVGQNWGLFTGPWAPVSLGHLAVPRLGGAGYLYRRAPQIRLSGDMGGELAVIWAVAAMAPNDKTAVATSAPDGVTGVLVGERSAVPDVEGRIAIAYRGALKAEVGVSGHWGQEKYWLATPADDFWVDSTGGAVDARIEVGPVTIIGGGFKGKNLDVWNSIAPGVILNAAAATATDLWAVDTKGLWAQLQITPVKGFQLVASAGTEQPDRGDLGNATIAGAGTTTFSVPYKNTQGSAGVIVNLTSRWRAGFEFTRYWTWAVNGTDATANQMELSTLFAF